MAKRMQSQSVVNSFAWSSTLITFADLQPGEAAGNTVQAGSVPQELAFAEISDDNGVGSQLASYDILRMGSKMDPTGDSAKGKWYVDLRKANSNVVDEKTQVRWIMRPRNGNETRELTGWYTLMALSESDPSKRIPLPPVTNKQGEPLYTKEGRVIALEIKNPASDVTVDPSKSTMLSPATVGY